MEKQGGSYRAYLLRCWREEYATAEGSPQWRFSLEEVPHERWRTGFTSLEALMAFLRAELADGEASEGEAIMPRKRKIQNKEETK